MGDIVHGHLNSFILFFYSFFILFYYLFILSLFFLYSFFVLSLTLLSLYSSSTLFFLFFLRLYSFFTYYLIILPSLILSLFVLYPFDKVNYSIVISTVLETLLHATKEKLFEISHGAKTTLTLERSKRSSPGLFSARRVRYQGGSK